MAAASELREALAVAFPLTIPVLTGFLALGIAYGLLMQTKGFGVVWAVLMSAVAFCGSMQFVAITLLTAVFNPVQAFFMSLMVNARHLFYGISMLDKYRGLGKVRGFLSMCFAMKPFRSHQVWSRQRVSAESIFIFRFPFWIICTGLSAPYLAACWGFILPLIRRDWILC